MNSPEVQRGQVIDPAEDQDDRAYEMQNSSRAEQLGVSRASVPRVGM